MKKIYFDFEVYANWWCMVYNDTDTIMSPVSKDFIDTYTVITSDDSDYIDRLRMLVNNRENLWIGYNIKHYDLIILNAIMQRFSPTHIKALNDLIMGDIVAGNKEQNNVRFLLNKKPPIIYQDLADDQNTIKITKQNTVTGAWFVEEVPAMSLKDFECNIEMDIVECDVPFDKINLTAEDKEAIIYYCKQDVCGNKKLWDTRQGYIKGKETIMQVFNIPPQDIYPKTNAALTAKALGASRKQFYDIQDNLTIPNKLKDYVVNNLPREVIVNVITTGEKLDVKLFGNEVTFGKGGLHSVIGNFIYACTNDAYDLLNVDGASYYPSLMRQFDYFPRTIQNKKVAHSVYDTRMELKRKGKSNYTHFDYLLDLAYKLVLNTIFGASLNKFLDLYDPLMGRHICGMGQLFMAALANKLYNEVPTCQIVQTNTDGIMLLVQKDYRCKAEQLFKEWENLTGIILETDNIKEIYQKDVNNYVEISIDGKEKIRGAWMTTDKYDLYGLPKNLNGRVSVLAAKEFLLRGTPIVKTIVSNTDVSDFCYLAKRSKKYLSTVQMVNGELVTQRKTNRVYATKDTSVGTLQKYRIFNGKDSYSNIAKLPEHCAILNCDLSTVEFSTIKPNIDYMHYILAANKLIDVKWRRLNG